MSKQEDLEVQLLAACERGELQTILELVEKKAVNPSIVVDKRRNHIVWLGHFGYDTHGWTPLHYAAA